MFSNSVFYLFVFVLSVQCAYDRSEGELCKTDEGVGKCVHIYRCLSSIIDLNKKDNPLICSFQSKEPVICCVDCELVNDTRNAVLDNEGGIIFKTGQMARDKCVAYRTYLSYPCQTNGLKRSWVEERQCYAFEKTFKTGGVEGRDPERSPYPHMALLGYGDDQNSAQWLCGGSLISEKYILTAAHCISKTVVGPVRFVALGIPKRTHPEKHWQVYNVMRVIAHPEYRPPSKYHDIALLETDRLVVFGKEVFPACLDYLGNDQMTAFATGWQLENNRPLGDNLQETSVEMYSVKDCQKHFPPHRLLKEGFKANMQMCYGDQKQPKDTCEGDSGGPLQVTSDISKCLHTITGVKSFGRGCGYAGDVAMFTRVFHYVPWIETVVWPEWS